MHPFTDPTASPRSTQTVAVEISGMSCGHCVAAVAGALRDVPGVTVQRIVVGSASVSIDPGAATVETVIGAIRDAGYDARLAPAAGPAT
jgi:copper chaperone